MNPDCSGMDIGWVRMRGSCTGMFDAGLRKRANLLAKSLRSEVEPVVLEG